MKKRRGTKPKIDCNLLSPVEIYGLILTGKRQKFPARFWTGPNGVENAVEVTRYLIETILDWSFEDIKAKLTKKVFISNGLGGMFSRVYQCSSWRAINAAYPNQFKEWELSTPNGFWNPETGIHATKWLIEEKLKWTESEVKERISQEVFVKNGLSGMLQVLYNSSPWQAINAAYPDRFKEWDLKYVPSNFWNMESGIRATKWLIEEKLKWTENEIKEKISFKVFSEFGLSRMLQRLYNCSPWEAVNAAYPNQFKEWQLRITPRGFWNPETGIRATKWLIEERLKWTENDIKEKLSIKVFRNNGLLGMLHNIYHASPWQAINAAYPNRFKEWEFKTVPQKFWNKETGIRATKWLIEEKLKWTETDIKKKLCYQVFIDNGLIGMLHFYNHCPWKAINAAYPNQFKEWELRYAPNNFWNEETAIRATKWLIEEKLKWTDHEIKEYFKLQTFRDYGLDAVIKKIFKKSPIRALNAVYPGRFQETDLKMKKISPKNHHDS